MRVKGKFKKVLGAVLLVLLLSPFVFYYMVSFGVWGALPSNADLSDIQNMQGSLVLATNGETIGRFYQQDRTPVKLDQIAPEVIECLVSTEDERFYTHDGTDYRSLLRVVIKSLLLQDQGSGGGSTLTQQLAKNLYPRVSAGLLYYPVNKAREVIIAGRLEEEYSKNELLELYLNTVSFGEDVYGIETASERFFSVKAAELSLPQAATLVGMLKATTSYNPVRHPEAASDRRNVVIAQLSRTGVLSDDSVGYWQDQPLVTNYQKPNEGIADYFVHEVKQSAKAWLESYNSQSEVQYDLEKSGLIIHTTLDYELQQMANTSFQEHLIKLQKQFDQHWPNGRLWQENDNLLTKQIEQIRHGRTDDELQVPKAMMVYMPTGEMTKEMSPMDSLKYYLGLLHAGFVSLDPQDGQIKTWVGGRDFEYFPYDHVDYSAKRQVGSVFKPLVYATALENDISPCTYYKAEQVAYEVEEGEWKPANSGNEYEGKYSMEGALESSINTVSVKILEDVGIENTISMAHDLGITSTLPEVPSVALGTASISLLEMVTAYCTLSNGGFAIEPHKITSITTSDGEVLYEYKQSKVTRVIDSETSAIMVYLLQNVVNDGTARSLRSIYQLSNDLGGKTGTTQGNADGWFMATTPKLVSGAWVGGAFPAISFRDTRLGQGATMALPIYAGFQQAMNKDQNFNKLSRAKYKVLSVQAANRVDCDPFKEDFEFFTWLFGNKKQKDSDATSGSEVKQPKEEKKFFKKIGSLFKKKKKD